METKKQLSKRRRFSDKEVAIQLLPFLVVAAGVGTITWGVTGEIATPENAELLRERIQQAISEHHDRQTAQGEPEPAYSTREVPRSSSVVSEPEVVIRVDPESNHYSAEIVGNTNSFKVGKLELDREEEITTRFIPAAVPGADIGEFSITAIPSPARNLPEDPNDDDLGEECKLGTNRTCVFPYRGIIFEFDHNGFSGGISNVAESARQEIEGGIDENGYPLFMTTKEEDVISANLEAIEQGRSEGIQEGEAEEFNVVSAIQFPASEFLFKEDGSLDGNIDKFIDIVLRYDSDLAKYVDRPWGSGPDVIWKVMCYWKRPGQEVATHSTNSTAGRYVFVLERVQTKP